MFEVLYHPEMDLVKHFETTQHRQGQQMEDSQSYQEFGADVLSSPALPPLRFWTS